MPLYLLEQYNASSDEIPSLVETAKKDEGENDDVIMAIIFAFGIFITSLFVEPVAEFFTWLFSL